MAEVGSAILGTLPTWAIFWFMWNSNFGPGGQS